MAEACQRCSAGLPEGANFCAACGLKIETEGLSRGQLLSIAALSIELFALAAMALFVVPRMGAALGGTGHHSAFTRLVFSPLWVPPFVLPVLVLGWFTVGAKRKATTRILLLSACLLIGLVPIFGSAMGIYVATFETALGEADGK